jgi:putative ABC transport system permease protein
VYIPLTAGLDLYNKKYLTYVSVKTSLPINEGKEQINVLIREMHNIDNPEGDPAKDDFHIQSQEDLVRSASQITNILQILLVSIAAISLIVGGIGIMNIMYVSVTERIKEIGLRKSIGARRTDVLKQFLAEALFLTLLGGLMGTLLGVTLSWLGIQIISQFQSGWTFAVSVRGIVLGVTVSGAIGVIFGYFPARKAASLHPIEALRFE